jgi:thymidylate synthase
MVETVLSEGTYKPNRTGVDTISHFSYSYTVDLEEGLPVLTTKDMSGFRWKSLIHELLWYFSGEEHIRNLREKTGIWDAWADEEGKLETAYGRFWRRFPVPDEDSQLPGEAWADEECPWVTEEEGSLVFDQVQYVLDTLNGDNPDKDHNSRRMVISAWHPANAAVSGLPPCHYTYVINVKDGKINTHLTQRSGDIALGVPFNIAAYSLITKIIAKQTDFEPGKFSHTVVDAHIYCGRNERGEWYSENLEELQERLASVEDREDFLDVKSWLTENAPAEEEEGYDHVPGLLKQLSRKPREKPSMELPEKGIDELEFEDFQLEDYNPHPGIRFEVAE